MYSTVEDCVKIVIGNKVDKAEQRAVSREEVWRSRGITGVSSWSVPPRQR